MIDSWMSRLELPLDAEQFRLLPRSAAFRYELYDGTAYINPRIRLYHARLDLEDARFDDVADVPLRPLRADDWEALVPLFADAFAQHQPFIGVPPDERPAAARAALEQTRTGGDGALIERACFAVLGEDGGVVGAILITLLPPGDPEDFDTYAWGGEVSPDAIDRCDGWPHLTWVFVSAERAGRGVGTALLEASARALRSMGFNDLLSTFLLGNEVSMLWHWRAGFQLLTYPGSPRRYMRGG